MDPRDKAKALHPHTRARRFAEEMREQGIHVGVGTPAVCVNCGDPWPCPTEHDAAFRAGKLTDPCGPDCP